LKYVVWTKSSGPFLQRETGDSVADGVVLPDVLDQVRATPLIVEVRRVLRRQVDPPFDPVAPAGGRIGQRGLLAYGRPDRRNRERRHGERRGQPGNEREHKTSSHE
jgi:hypothetical protein